VKKILVAAGFSAAVVIAGIGTAAAFTHTPEFPFAGQSGSVSVPTWNASHGSKSDRDAYAFWLDSGGWVTGLSDPAHWANTVCSLRSQGFGEAQIEPRMRADIPVNPIAGPARATSLVRAAEFHFCPVYYSQNPALKYVGGVGGTR
jgi:hypothetical protein